MQLYQQAPPLGAVTTAAFYGGSGGGVGSLDATRLAVRAAALGSLEKDAFGH